MRDKKYYIALDDFEQRVVVNCLNEMRKTLLLMVSHRCGRRGSTEKH